jgi:hypothetical protein
MCVSPSVSRQTGVSLSCNVELRGALTDRFERATRQPVSAGLIGAAVLTCVPVLGCR